MLSNSDVIACVGINSEFFRDAYGPPNERRQSLLIVVHRAGAKALPKRVPARDLEIGIPDHSLVEEIMT